MTSVPPNYDEAYYQDYDGQRYERSQQWASVFGHFANNIVTTLDPARTLDAGCAIGLLVEALHDRGVDAYGFDISEYAISQVPEELSGRCWVQSLTEPLAKTYDLVTCIEVIEHLPPAEAADAVANLCSVTDAVLLSSTPTEHEEPTHLNVQPPEYWSALFARHGFLRDVDFDATFVSPWAVLYRRRPFGLVDTVRTYDRAWWRLRDENQRMRDAFIRTTQERGTLAKVLTDDEWDLVRAGEDGEAALEDVVARVRAERAGGSAASPKAVELTERLRDAEHRLTVQRDELLGAQRREGEAFGRVIELEAELGAHAPLRELYGQAIEQRDEAERRYREIAGSTSWRVVQKLLAPYRRITGRGSAVGR